jgi:hypothetical protein
MLDHVQNGISPIGREAAPRLVTRQSGRGIGDRRIHRFILAP